ncbi:MAG TPA: gliding motility-associated C-terminal domain-containing protein, partial [Flavobacterium sp.]|nr:gliding motility-associated C-terminal domain-containing protein [Flavobacterium sp.]
GSWEADAKNPAPTLIATPNSKATDISGFSAPGDYVFHWKTRYCDKTITYNYLGINDKPVVENPTIYCLNSVATPLTATVPSGFTAVWYNQEFGGTGSTTAPTPDTSAAGNSQKYYVAALDAVGCEGPRVEIVVQVNDLPTASISGNTTICPGSTAVVSFTGTPDATVTYTVDSGAPQTIVLDASGNASITTPVLNANSTYALISVATAGTPSCSQTVTGSVTITVNSLPSATISAITPICSGNTSEVLIVGTPNATVTYTVDAGAEQTVVLDPLGNATIITPVLTANSTYTLVNIAFEGSADCSQALNDSVVIVVNGLPTAAISSDITICSGATAIVTFVGTPNATIAYKADTVDATVALDASGNASVITPVLTANSTYELVSATSAGTPVCTQLLTGSMLITVNPLPTATISGTTTICSGSTAEITFSGTPNTIVTYSVNSATATVTLDASGNAIITTPAVASTTTYNLVSVAYSGTSDCSQSLTGSTTVSVLELPTASISGTTTVCPGATAVITFTGTPNATVTYTVDAVSATIALDATGNASLTTPVLTASSTYQLVSVATNGTPACSQSVSGSAVITLSSPEFTITASPESLCANQEGLLTVNVTNNTSGAPVTYTYTLPDGSTQVSSSNTLAINAIGTYTVGVNIQGCENSNSITVNENTSAFDISFEQGCNANSYQLTALIDDSLNPENATYTWSGPSFEETENGNTIVLKAAGSYSVSITTADGCTSSDSVMVNSIACLIQQGISPNNDGKNDNFDLEALNVKHLSIYNRYGSKVYDMANYTNQWYGTTNDGKELPDGTYYYVIERDGMESVTGWIYVIHEHK